MKFEKQRIERARAKLAKLGPESRQKVAQVTSKFHLKLQAKAEPECAAGNTIVNSVSKVWIPAVSPPSLATALSVPFHSQSKISPDLYRHLLEAKLDALIQATSPVQARDAMEGSLEHAPNLYAIAQNVPRHQWASAIVQSDQLDSILSSLSWEGTVRRVPEQTLDEVLEAITL